MTGFWKIVAKEAHVGKKQRPGKAAGQSNHMLAVSKPYPGITWNNTLNISELT